MALRTTLPPSAPAEAVEAAEAAGTPSEPEERFEQNEKRRFRTRRVRWVLTPAWSPGDSAERRPPRALVAALLVTGLSLVSLDHLGADASPVDGARAVVGEVVAPLEVAASAAVRPVGAVSDWFATTSGLREDAAALEAENAELRRQVAGADIDRERLASYDGLLAAAGTHDVAMVPARVVAVGAAQSFSRTVTLDAGTSSGIEKDQTVVAADGLVGRVISTTSSSATVVLIIDADSTVGARVGRSQEVGFLTGSGDIASPNRIDLELVDPSVVPAAGDSVLTWGSANTGPYRAGIPIGEVVELFSTPRDTTQRAVIEPYVDFSTLDVVGVIVPPGTSGERGVIQPDGSIR